MDINSAQFKKVDENMKYIDDGLMIDDGLANWIGSK